MNARELLSIRSQTSQSRFVEDRVREVQVITERQVFRGKVQGRNPSTGEYRIDTGSGRFRWAKSVASSDINGKDVVVTIGNTIGQIAEMPGFL
jgi:hypothetical protein